MAGISSHSGDHRAHSTRSGCLVAWLREFHLYSGDSGSYLKPGLNRDRLCGQRSRRSSRSVSAESCGGEETRRGKVCMYVDVLGGDQCY